MLYPGPPGSPTGTLYEVIGEVELVPASQAGAGPSQPARTSKPTESERNPDRKKTPVPERTRSSQVRRKSTKWSAKSGRGRTLEQSRTPERANTPERIRAPDRTKTLDRGKAPMSQVSPALALDCMIVGQWMPPPSHAMSAKDPRTTSVSCVRNRERTTGSDPSPVQSSRKEKKAFGIARSRSGDGSGEDPSAAGDFEEEIAPSPNMRRVFTRLQEHRLLTPKGSSSAISGPASHPKDGTTSKKHRTT